jgi:hypothetical protein
VSTQDTHSHLHLAGDTPVNPSGLCMCGCGAKTALARVNGPIYLKGDPVRYIEGHNAYAQGPRWQEEDRGYVSECWIWQRGTDKHGYGRTTRDKRTVLAHRAVYEECRGPIPTGLELDHLCRVTSCVNPSHLEAVTHRINMLRGGGPVPENAAKTHCHRGHPFDAQNTRYEGGDPNKRHCKTCDRAAARRQHERKSNAR